VAVQHKRHSARQPSPQLLPAWVETEWEHRKPVWQQHSSAPVIVSAGVTVLGYVPTDYARKSQAVVMNDIAK